MSSMRSTRLKDSRATPDASICCICCSGDWFGSSHTGVECQMLHMSGGTKLSGTSPSILIVMPVPSGSKSAHFAHVWPSQRSGVLATASATISSDIVMS